MLPWYRRGALGTTEYLYMLDVCRFIYTEQQGLLIFDRLELHALYALY